MSSDIQFAHVLEVEQLVEADQIEQVVSTGDERQNRAVYQIVAWMTNEQQRRGKRQQFENDATDRDVRVLLDPLVEPFDPIRKHERTCQEHPHQRCDGGKTRYDENRNGEPDHHNRSRGGNDDEQLLDDAREPESIVAHARTFTHAVYVYAEEAQRGRPSRHTLGK